VISIKEGLPGLNFSFSPPPAVLIKFPAAVDAPKFYFRCSSIMACFSRVAFNNGTPNLRQCFILQTELFKLI
jgi:hypothetical protein